MKTTLVSALVSLLLAAAAAGCAGTQTPLAAKAAEPAPARPAATLQLDEAALPPVNRLQPEDLDPATGPCLDFAAHVNGKWLAANDLPGDRTTWGAFEMLDERSKAVQRQLAEQAATAGGTGVVKIVGDLWATGMDAEAINAQGLEPLRSRLDAIEALDGREAIVEHLRVTAARGEGFLFGFGPEADFEDSSQNIAYITQGGLGLPDKTYYVDEDKKEKLDAYLAHIQRVLELSGVAPEAARAQAERVLAFEARLAQASRSKEELSRDVSLWFNPVTLAEADALTPNFSWTRFFASQGLASQPRLSLAMPEFHAEVSRMLGEVPVEDWKAYLRFHTVDGASPYLSDAFAEEHFNFYKKALRGQKEMRPRYKRVLDMINAHAGEALGQLYVDVAFPPSSKARMQELVQNLSVALKARIERLEWMGPETKKKALEKWASFTPKIGYPDKWRDWSAFSTSRSSLIENVLRASEFNYRHELSKIGKPVDKTEWHMSPQTVNAYYNPLQNEIVFPAAILQPPFFDPEADAPLNYGGIGAVIGHEMIHGYDDQGSRFGPTGNFEVWWTKEDAERFATKTAQLVEQFDAYEAFPGGKVNGKLTLGENIADLGGLAVAYDAMRAATAGQEDPRVGGISRAQRFFMNWATVWRRKFTPDELKVRLATDSHAPAQFRAMGPPSNLESFRRVFECKSGDPMVREGDARIVIW